MEDFFKGTAFTAISGIASMMGLILSIILIIITAKVAKIIRSREDIKHFNENRIAYSQNLKAFQVLITIDKIFDIQLVTNISNSINLFENLTSILTKKDKKNINSIKKELDKNIADVDETTKRNICRGLSYFIGRYGKEEIIL